MNEYSRQLEEAFALLWRATKNERSRFIVIQYNHYGLVHQILREIPQRYPNRPLHRFNLQSDVNHEFANKLLQFSKGFLAIEHFEEIFKVENRVVASTLNQRRDAFSSRNTILLIFLPMGNAYLRSFAECMPDFRSVVNPVVQLIKMTKQFGKLKNISNPIVLTGYNSLAESQRDIERIELRLSTLQPTIKVERLPLSMNFDLGKAYFFLGNYKKSKNILTRILQEINILDTVTFHNVRAVLGQIESELGNHMKAIEIFEDILDSNLVNYEKKQIVPDVHQAKLADAYIHAGRYSEAVELLEWTLESLDKIFDMNHSSFITYQSTLGSAYLLIDKYTKAINLLKSSLQLARKNFEKSNLTISICLNNFSQFYFKTKEYNKCKSNLLEAYSIYKSNFLTHPHMDVIGKNLQIVESLLKK